jgi:hypothetical protein
MPPKRHFEGAQFDSLSLFSACIGRQEESAALRTHVKGCGPWAMKRSEWARRLGLPTGFTLHLPQYVFLAQFGEAGGDAFTIMKLAGRSGVTASGRQCIRRRKSLKGL